MWTWLKRRLGAVAGHREPAIWICNAAILNTVEVLRRRGSDLQEHEGVAYWAGKRLGADCLVTTCVAPAAATTHGSFHTTSEANARVIMYLAKVGLELVAQVHSHPGPFVDHSPGDDERATDAVCGLFFHRCAQLCRKWNVSLDEVWRAHLWTGTGFDASHPSRLSLVSMS